MSTKDSITNDKLSADEIALYDRQIRLWGMEAQARMRSANVLLINMGSIGTEITKNIVLSGLGSLTIMDDHIVTEDDLGSQFFLSKNAVGSRRLDVTQERIKDLNPRVTLVFDNTNFSSQEHSFFKKYDLIIATELKKLEIIALNNITREFNIPLYVCGSNGLFAYIFVDLIEISSEDEKLKSAIPTQVGKVSQNKEVITVSTRVDEDDPKKVYEKITTKHMYKPFDEVINTASLTGKLNRRQMKRLSSVVPLTFAALQHDDHSIALTPEILKNNLSQISERFGVPVANVKEEDIQQFSNQKGVEFAPVSAIIGGAVSQDVINILGKKQSPINNMILFDGITLDMPIYEF